MVEYKLLIKPTLSPCGGCEKTDGLRKLLNVLKD